MTTPDPLFERLRGLRRPTLDDVAAARTLARAEEAFTTSFTNARPGRGTGRPRWPVPAALVLWSALYIWGAIGALGRIFPAERHSAPQAIAFNYRPAR